MDAKDIERALHERVKARARELDQSAPAAPTLAEILQAEENERPSRLQSRTGLGLAVVSVAAIVLGIAVWSLRLADQTAVGGASGSSSTTSTAKPSQKNGNQPMVVTWRTGDLSLPKPPTFQQLVPIGDRLFLMTSDNAASRPTASLTGGIWATADGLTWTKQRDIAAIKSPGTTSQSLIAASPNGHGGAVVVGSERTTEGTDTTAVWWTTDGQSWGRASVEGPAGRMLSVTGRLDGLVAVGITATLSGEAAAWRSTDGGASWTSVPLPGGGRDAVDVTVWGSRFVAIGRSQDANQLMLWTSSDGASWSLVQSPSDPSFMPTRLIPFGNALVVLGSGVPGSAILTCGNDLTCARASMPDLGFTASVTEVRAGAEVSGTIIVNALSGTAGTAASPAPSPAPSVDPARGDEFLISADGRTWRTLRSSPSLVVVTSNLVVFRGRLVAVVVGPDLTSVSEQVMVGTLG